MGQPRRIAVLGAAGFIGTHVARRLAELGHDVVPVDIRTVDADLGATGAISADLRSREHAEFAVRGAHWVVHLAADMGGVGYFHGPADWAASMDNALMTRNVLTACARFEVERLFYASSACAYPVELQRTRGRAPRLAETEVGFGTPDQLYGGEKLTGLRLCSAAPFDARVGILHTIYGPGQEATGPRAKFPPAVCAKAIASEASGAPIEIWGDGSQLRSYLYIDDAVDRIITILTAEHYHGPVNVGYDGAISCLDAAQHAARAAGADPARIVCNPDAGPTGVLARDCDNTKWRATYGHTDDVPPAEGFGRLVDWLQRRKQCAR
jgi:GDP-D-mannose 3',5'-epimerase